MRHLPKNWFGIRLRIASLVIGLVALTWLSYRLLVQPRVHSSLRREAERGISLYARLTAAQIDDTISSAMRELEAIASLPQIRSMDPDQAAEALAHYDQTSPYLLHFFLLDQTGSVVARPSKPERVGSDRSKRDYFSAVMESKQPYVSSAVISTAGNRSLVAAVPVFDDRDQVEGVLIGSLGFMDRNSQLYQAIVDPIVERPMQVFLVGRGGALIASSIGAKSGTERATPGIPRSPVAPEQGQAVVFEDSRRWLVTTAPLDNLGWQVIARIPNAAVEDDVAQVTKSFQLAILVSLAGVLLIGLVVGQWLLGPLDRLTRALRSYGDTGLAEPVAVSGPAEVREAQHAFNAMMEERARAAAERDRLERQLLHAQKLQTIGTLTGGISHDFNNLLTPILLASEYLARSLPADTRPGVMARDIVAGATRASELVARILTFSRAAEVHRQPVDAAAVIRESLELAEVSVPSRIELVSSIEPVGVVCADSVQLSQVLLNLCSNAVDAIGDQPGRIEVSLRPAADPTRCVLSVADSGCGISPETVERMFDPFFTTKDVGKGTGLGLSVVHGIISDHDGTIEVDSEAGRGTRIDIFLPLVSDDGPPQDSPSSQVAAVGGVERILLVEDDTMVATAAERLLGDLGYRVEVETDPVAGIERARAEPHGFELIVCDLSMPRVSGFDLIDAIREFRPNQRFVIITGNIDQATQQRCAALGVGAVVQKPFEGHELAAALRRALDRPVDRG